MRTGRAPTKALRSNKKRSNFKPVAPLPHALLRIPSPIIMLKRSFTIRTIAPIHRTANRQNLRAFIGVFNHKLFFEGRNKPRPNAYAEEKT
ncbi:unnamed protein product, partial [Brenthis ino]